MRAHAKDIGFASIPWAESKSDCEYTKRRKDEIH